MSKRLDMRGFSNRRLTVIGDNAVIINSKAHWECRCSCGTVLFVNASELKSGNKASCGCLISEKKKQKDNRYRVWCGMIQRCTNPNAPKYPRYGAKGIKICDRWMSFDLFAEDMGPRPAGTTLDRKESKGDYCPDNCRWATHTEQNRNRSWVRNLTIYGLTMSVSAWSEISGIPASTIITRLDKGMAEKLAVFTPSIKKGRGSANWGKKNAV